ncbi:multidrug effflux MFS transporter [Piscirickettsia salmonis]|uniref:multidrug effflux MFS transporter n=1 Tax=Piscirickettsia salmonis TaxID=1238 RepID=UPI000F079A2A|nr:Bcr/CflA family drug resistance efflux transporter [Piscirickettsiaceae bacterium NZ-RLO2]
MTNKSNNPTALILFFILLIVPIGQVAIDIYLPSLPYISQELAISTSITQWSLTVYLLSSGLSQFFYGPISDSLGRKPILCCGLIIFFIGSLVCAQAQGELSLLAGRLLQGLGIGAGAVISNAMVGDHFHGIRLAKVTSLSSFAYGISPIIAPFIGGLIQTHLGWRFNFYFLLIITAASLLLAIALLPETLNKQNKQHLNIKTLKQNYLSILTQKIFWGYVLCMTLSFAISISFNVIGPFLLQQTLHFSPAEFGTIALSIGAAYLLGTLSSGRLLHFFSSQALIAVGNSLMLISGISGLTCGLILGTSTWGLLIPLYLSLYASGLIFPNCMAGALALTRNIGTISALLGLIITAGVALISFLIAFLPVYSQLPLSCLMVALPLCQIIFYYFWIRPNPAK